MPVSPDFRAKARRSLIENFLVKMNPYEARNIEDLKLCVSSDCSPKYVFFWGHKSSKSGRVSKACLSQWYPASFVVDAVTYPTAEHYMMASKARLFDDRAALDRILASTSPGAAKAAGRQVRDFDETLWRRRRFDIVMAGNLAKFDQYTELRDFLLGTRNRVLVEASPHDRVWGIGLSEKSPAATNPLLWKGLNILGFALMEVRDRLR